MRLDEAGQQSTIPELISQFQARPWHRELAALAATTPEPITVRLYRSGCQTEEPIETGKGPYASTRYWEQLQPDIANEREGEDGRFFPPALLDRYGDLDFKRAMAAARAGEPLFLPGVEESFPTRLQPRPT